VATATARLRYVLLKCRCTAGGNFMLVRGGGERSNLGYGYFG
jgi:hypothetical protein